MARPVDGALCHAEITANDVERCKTFYSEVFGWEFTEIPEVEYTIFQSGHGGIGGGVIKRGKQTPTHSVHYMQCHDLDATIERITSNGGTIVMPKTAFGDVGWLAHATDTEGNLFGLWQGKRKQ
jgi:predicted enzyme related to lactoylglutathione lyase